MHPRCSSYGVVASLATFLVLVCGCSDPNSGQSAAHETPVADGQIVLVRRTNEVGGFILRNQKSSPEQTDYIWFYRSDGKGRLSPGDPAVSTGIVSNAAKVSFASFSIGWSIRNEGKGWVYFSALPTQLGKAADYEMCVTTETNAATIDANDRRWKYRSRPSVNLRALIESQVKK